MKYEMENNEKEFEPSWGVLASFYAPNNVIIQKLLVLTADNFDDKPEITTRLINQANTVIFEQYKYSSIVFTNLQIVWINEPLK